MFNNLIESSSHRKEFKRRGSFLLFTTGTYILLFVITGVASIYAYDANLGEQSYEINWLPPVDLTPQRVEAVDPVQHQRQTRENNRGDVAERAQPMLSIKHPEVVPTGVSVTPNKNLPIPEGGLYRVTGRDRDPFTGGNTGPAIDGSGLNNQMRAVRVDVDDPPPVPAPTPNRVFKISKVLNSQALSLPRPIYPMLARQARIQGIVSVQVLIDENGKVVSAKAVSGPPLLILEAQKAALQARFSPTIVSDQPVRVSGVITYNFLLQ